MNISTKGKVCDGLIIISNMIKELLLIWFDLIWFDLIGFDWMKIEWWINALRGKAKYGCNRIGYNLERIIAYLGYSVYRLIDWVLDCFCVQYLIVILICRYLIRGPQVF